MPNNNISKYLYVALKNRYKFMLYKTYFKFINLLTGNVIYLFPIDQYGNPR